MASRNDGIQLLLQAEKAAAEKVAEAKRRKLKRLKEAKQEALTEIEIEKNEREKQYKALEDEAELAPAYQGTALAVRSHSEQKSVFGRRSGIQAQINQVTQKTLELQADSMRQHKDSAINMLLETVLSIEPRLHINFRPELSAVK